MRRRFEIRRIEIRKLKKGIDYYSHHLNNLELGEIILQRNLPAFQEARQIKAEKIVSKNNLFDSAKYCEVKEIEGKDLFHKAINCKVEKLKAKSAFLSAKKCKVDEAEAEEIFEKARNCEGGKIVAKQNAFLYGKNCKVKEIIITSERPLERALENIFFGAFLEAKNCEAEIVKGGKSIFEKAQKCLAERIYSKNIGFFSRGVVILDDVEGRVFPSVVFIGDRIKEEREKIKEFFERELRKSQSGKESIFDILRFFDWEGETLEEGKKKLEERWKRIKENISDLTLKKLENYFFYFLLNNDQREKIFLNFPKLSERERDDLFVFNFYRYLEALQENKEYLNFLSLEDWIKLTNFLDENILRIDPKTIESLKKEGMSVRDAIFEAIEEKIKREAENTQKNPRAIKIALSATKEVLKNKENKALFWFSHEM